MWQTIGLTVSVLAVIGLGLVTARRLEGPLPKPPAVSALPGSRLPPEVAGKFAAQVAVEGQHFDVYVGKIPGVGSNAPRHWSVAVPVAD